MLATWDSFAPVRSRASSHLPTAASHPLKPDPTFPLCVKVRLCTPLQGAEGYHIEDNSWRDDAQTPIHGRGNGTHLELYS